MRGLGLLAVAACGLAVAAPIPKEKDKPKKDEDVIQGTWAMEKFDGGQAPPAGLGPIQMTFKDGKLAVEFGGKLMDQGTYKMDPTAKLKTIDLTNGPATALGIYELDGDTLRICVGDDAMGAGRPTELKGNEQIALITLKRVKEDKKEK